MSEIPEDINAIALEVAHKAPSITVGDSLAPLRLAIAEALMAERERCAKIARNSVMVAFFDGTDQAAATRVNRACNKLAEHIAAKIEGTDHIPT